MIPISFLLPNKKQKTNVFCSLPRICMKMEIIIKIWKNVRLLNVKQFFMKIAYFSYTYLV